MELRIPFIVCKGMGVVLSYIFNTRTIENSICTTISSTGLSSTGQASILCTGMKSD